MATQRVVVNGTDITGYLKALQCSVNDIDAPGSGRDMNGTMMRARVASKAKLQFTCRILSDAELAAVSSAVNPETVTVTYLDPFQGQRTAQFYGSSMETAVWNSDGGRTYWQDVSFSLIEV